MISLARLSLASLLFAVVGCSDQTQKQASSSRGAKTCEEQGCERVDIGFVNFPESFELATTQTIHWEESSQAESYDLVISKVPNCSSVVLEVKDLTIAQADVTIASSGVYYACLFVTTATSDQPIETTGSRVKFAVKAPKRALINYGGSAEIPFGERVIGAEIFAQITLANQGTENATDLIMSGLAEPIRFRGLNKEKGAYPGEKGDCGTILEPEESCVISLAFLPTKENAISVNLEIVYFDSSETKTETIMATGSGIKPAVLGYAVDGDVTFGTVTVGESANQSLTIKNTGGASAVSITPQSLAAPWSYKGGNFPGTGGTCTNILEAAANCKVVLSFTPVEAGEVALALTINYSDGAASQALDKNLNGTGQ